MTATLKARLGKGLCNFVEEHRFSMFCTWREGSELGEPLQLPFPGKSYWNVINFYRANHPLFLKSIILFFLKKACANSILELQ